LTRVIYARYSSDSQREESIEGQLRECKEFAEKSGITILNTYIDRALSAKTDNRPEFQRMIKDSAKGLFDVVIVWKLDRFARNRYDSAHYKAILRKNGVKVTSARETIGDCIDREQGLFVIKPSGVEYEKLTPEDMVVLDLQGNVIEGHLKPSSDMATHCVLYNSFPAIGGVAHTHSRKATAWAQAGRRIPALGTTHADYFYGEIPCTRRMSAEEIAGEYERETGRVICEALAGRNPMETPGALVHSHGPFTWGVDAMEAVCHSVIFEEIAAMALDTCLLGCETPMQKELLEKHFQRKHGTEAYYGQA